MHLNTKKQEILDDIIDKKFLALFNKYHKSLSDVEKRLWSAGSSRESQATATSSTIIPELNSKEKIFEICVENMQLSSLAVKYLNTRFKKCAGVRVCWHFLNFESSTPLIQAREGNIKVHESKKYKVTPDDHFLNFTMRRKILFDLYGVYGPENKHVGRGVIDAKCILTDFECTRTIDVLSVDKMKIFMKSKNSSNICAKIVIVFKWRSKDMKPMLRETTTSFSESKEMKQLFFNSDTISSNFSMSLSLPESTIKRRGGESDETVTSSAEFSKDSSLEDLDYLYIRSILDSIVDRATSTPKNLSQPVKNLTSEDIKIKWRRTLEEYAILSGQNPYELDFQSISNLTIRDYPTPIFDPTVIINVLTLKFEKGAKELKKFYIEYAFLSKYGKDMESESVSLAKDDTFLKFNFRKIFEIDMQFNFKECKLLATFIRNKKFIQFFVNEEPLQECNKFQICKEIGSCKVNLFDLIQRQENSSINDYPVQDTENSNFENIGTLKISFSGIQAMRRVALKILAPEGYV